MAPPKPTEGDVGALQEMLSIPRAQAVILIEKYVNVERAVNQYFEDPSGSVKRQPSPNQWEPADNLPSFRIDADDTTHLTAMSRPPSRIGDRMSHNTGNRMQAESGMPSSEELNDHDLQRAIEMSREGMSAQETGVIDAGQQFGPANRPYYDTNQWAMTTIASSREIFDHPPPSKRQRLAGQPVFLRGSPETGYLAPLLNIYHSIPLAREAFLLPSMKVLNYGHDPQWWAGTSDENVKSLSIESSDRGGQDRQNFLSELQCLMAFLDESTRAYGSVDALADLRAMKIHSYETQLSRLLETWVAAAMIQSPDDQLTQVFTSTALKASPCQGIPPDKKDLVCLEPPVRRVEGQTLVNLLDSTIWDDVFDRIDDIWIHQCAQIFTMRLFDPGNEDRGLGLEIPAVWYPDRYMYEHREITHQWRREMLALRYEINQCAIIQRRCEAAQGPGKRVIKIRDVLDAASRMAAPENHMDDSTGNEAEPVSNPSATLTPDDESEAGTNIHDQLQAIIKRIEDKVRILEERKKELFIQIKSIASQLTQPEPNSPLSPRHKYYLQGVSTKSNITYLRRLKHEPQTLIDTLDDNDNIEYQWWRIVWGKDGQSDALSTESGPQPGNQQSHNARDHLSADAAEDQIPYTVQTVEEADVLEAAKFESNSIVLVYANENAMNFVPSSPSVALKKFIEQDNRAFRDSLPHERLGNNKRYSQDTNTTIMEDIPIENQQFPSDELRETTPMSTTSPLRDADGQPSPKRAKADEAYQFYREGDSSEEEPPSYEDTSSKPQMQEKKLNKIGILADQMLQRYGGDVTEKPGTDEPIHIEHARDPLR